MKEETPDMSRNSVRYPTANGKTGSFLLNENRLSMEKRTDDKAEKTAVASAAKSAETKSAAERSFKSGSINPHMKAQRAVTTEHTSGQNGEKADRKIRINPIRQGRTSCIHDAVKPANPEQLLKASVQYILSGEITDEIRLPA